MKLLPSLRQKKRYLVFEIVSKNDKFTASDLEQEVNNALFSFIGTLGLANAAPLFLKERFNSDKQRFILKINNKYVDEAKAAMSLIKKVKNKTIIVKSLITTGTIKKANEVLLK